MSKTIPLSPNGKIHAGKYIAVVDDEDYARVNKFSWSIFLSSKGRQYAKAYTKSKTGQKFVFLHRLVMEVADPKTIVEHRDGNGLNCTRDNLRLATQSQNLANRNKISKTRLFKGVCLDKKTWAARVKIDGKQIHIGNFQTPEAAARAYDAVVLKHFGEFARLNFPQPVAAA